MDIARLITGLRRPAAYPHPVGEVAVRQTHISAVFLAGDYAYKLKKPVRMGFLDFSTPELRRHFCEQEVTLNRRLAPDVYLGVVPVVQTPEGPRFGGDGEVIDWAVKMRRLPDDATLAEWVRRGEADRALLERLAERLARFHAETAANERTASVGRWETVARNVRENFEQVPPSPLIDRVRALSEEALAKLRPLIERRAERGVPRDCHGDFRLDHVYVFPGRTPPGDLVVIDCIEFNERFRYIDPVADAAFLVMDLRRAGRRDLADAFADTYFRASGDEEGRELLPFYVAYRAVVRAKVEWLKAAEAEVPEAERAESRARSAGYWLLALGELERPERRPCLVLVGGLPGSGKSTLARGLAAEVGFTVIRSDAVRKELAGLAPDERGAESREGSIYTPEWDERTYRACRGRAAKLLAEGGRVLVDASFREDARRRDFLALAASCGVPAVFLLCRCEPEVARRRLEARRGDVSDADWAVYRQLASAWQEPGPEVRPALEVIDSGRTPEAVLAEAREVLRRRGVG